MKRNGRVKSCPQPGDLSVGLTRVRLAVLDRLRHTHRVGRPQHDFPGDVGFAGRKSEESPSTFQTPSTRPSAAQSGTLDLPLVDTHRPLSFAETRHARPPMVANELEAHGQVLTQNARNLQALIIPERCVRHRLPVPMTPRCLEASEATVPDAALSRQE